MNNYEYKLRSVDEIIAKRNEYERRLMVFDEWWVSGQISDDDHREITGNVQFAISALNWVLGFN